MREITMSTAVLAALLDSAEASASSRSKQVLLNPQPLPPREGYPPWPRPRPGDWRSVVRVVVERHLDRLEQAGIIIVSGDVEHVVDRSTQELADFATALVGEAPGLALTSWSRSTAAEPGSLAAVDLVLAGLELQQAADGLPDHPLHEALAQAAEQLLDVGVARAGVR